MNPLYIQRLLSVLLEEYQDIDYMLGSMEGISLKDDKQIRQLLNQLDRENHRLIERLAPQPTETPVP